MSQLKTNSITNIGNTGDANIVLGANGDTQIQSLNSGPLSSRQKLINGGFDIWQRGTVGMPAPSAVTYYADRWASFKSSGAAVNDVQQIADAPNVPGVTFSTRTNACDLRQVIENGGKSLLKAGTTWTFSGWAKGNGAATTIRPSIIFCQDRNAAGGTTTEVHMGPLVSVGTGWTSWSTTFTVAANAPAGQDHAMVVSAAQGDVFQTAIQLEPGSVQTPLEIRPLQIELALCQRYYYEYDNGGVVGGLFMHTFMGGSGVRSGCYVTHPQQMLKAPNVTNLSVRNHPSAYSDASDKYMVIRSDDDTSGSNQYPAVFSFQCSAEL